MTKDKIPVTIITGFLGAGKTTFLNHLIKTNSDKKFAVIENEFGDIPIDQELVTSASDGIFEMSNGCICCSLNAELAQLLQKLLDGSYNFDHLLIETTGIAEPDAVAAHFIGANRETRYILDGTVCLADTNNIEQDLHERGEAIRQVSFADLILLNKTDLTDDLHVNKAIDLLRQYNAFAQVMRCEFGNAPVNALQLQAYDGQRLESNFLAPHSRHHHHDELVAHSFEYKEPLIAEKFEHWINMLLFLSGYQIYRVKGILNLHDESRKVVFQSVRSSIKLEMGTMWQEGETRLTKIVFIGYNLKRQPIQKGLEDCLKKSAGS